MPEHKAEHLVVDTTAFINNKNLQDIASNIYTVEGVVNEITSKRQLRRLAVLPYDLEIKHVFPENIKFVTDFAKKTGDYTSLSAIDIQVMALAYQLEKEHSGTDHLNTVPHIERVAKFSEQLPSADLSMAGFYMPPKKEVNSEDLEKENVIQCVKKETELKTDQIAINPEASLINKEELGEIIMRKTVLEVEAEEAEAMKQLEEALSKAEVSDDADILEVGDSTDDQGLYSEEGGFASESDDSDIWDDQAWITPENIDDAKRELQNATEITSSVKVACITGDFAMQNVLRQIGLHAMAADGRTIKQLRTFILRCYACNKTTSKIDLLFCPHCGNKTLRKAAVMLKEDGTQEIKFVWRRPPTGRGRKFTLPKPQGGLHANNPLLCPDQKFPPQLASKLARTKTNPLDPDYIAGYSPFALHDVNSKSAKLGIRSNHTQVKNWMRRNPNEVVKKGKGKKRK